MTVTESKTIVIGRDDDSATLAANDRRKKLIITNTANSGVLYVKLSDTGTIAANNHDFVLTAKETNGATFVLDNYSGPVKASATTVTFVELG